MSGEVHRIRSRATGDASLSAEALARACAGADPAAIAALFDRFHRPVARYLRRLTGESADVDDLLQNTFLEIVRGKAVYDGRASVLTWLFAIATNVARHHRRSGGRRRRLQLAVAWARPVDRQDVAEQTDSRIKLARAHHALAALGAPLREAFVLCELEGLSARQTAAVVGASEAAVWKRVSKARKAIRRAVLGGSAR